MKEGGDVLIWSAATCRRFPTVRDVAPFQSADMSAHSKIPFNDGNAPFYPRPDFLGSTFFKPTSCAMSSNSS
jgi:hypothetical protein